MVFNCRQCGSCCMFLGDYIVIERQTGPFTFECESVSTGTPFTAEVDEDKRTIFSDFTFPEQPSGCLPFPPPGRGPSPLHDPPRQPCHSASSTAAW